MAPARRSLQVRAGAPALAAPLLASAHFVLSEPVTLAALSGMAATAMWVATKRPEPVLPPRRAAASRASAQDWARVAQACAAAAAPVMALMAVKAALGQMQLNPRAVDAAAICGTLNAGLAGVHAALAGVVVAVSHGALEAHRMPGALAAAAAVMAPLATLAHAAAMQQGLRWAPSAPMATQWACYGAALGHHVGSVVADSLQAARAPAWCVSGVLQSATCAGAVGGAAAALALWRV